MIISSRLDIMSEEVYCNTALLYQTEGSARVSRFTIASWTRLGGKGVKTHKKHILNGQINALSVLQ